MLQLLAFIQKELRHIMRDRRTLMILFGMPIAQVMLFGFVLTNEIKDANIAILDPSRDSESIALTNKLLSSGYFHAADYLDSPSELEPAFRSGKIKLAVVFPENFGSKLERNESTPLQLIGDATDPNTATTLILYARSIVQDFQTNGNKAIISAETHMRYNPEQKEVFNFVPGVMTLILMLISAMMTSITLAREKELGTLEVLLVSPLRPYQIIFGKTLPYLVLSFLNAIVVVILGVFVFEMPMNGSILLLGLECLLYMFVSLALGILISTRVSNQLSAMFASAIGLMMPTVLLSGFIFPQESMPIVLQWIGYAIPATWFNPIIKSIMIKGVGLTAIWVHTAALGGMAVFFMVASIRGFKDKLA